MTSPFPRDARTARDLLAQIHALPLDGKVRVMNVCGGHERSITMAGLRGALPPNIELIPGPGCPVCVCPEEDVHAAIQLALRPDVTLVTFGDMLRVPANVPKTEPRSLEQARAAGGDVRPVASPAEALTIARDNPGREVVFFAAGFETTTAPVVAMLAGDLPPNLSVLLSARLTWPAVAMLLDSEEAGFDALIAPGHVATVMGPEEWGFVVDKHGLPTAIAGFETDSILRALLSVLRQRLEGRVFLDNCYTGVVRPGGNPTARALMDRTLDVVDANWRGIGVIPASGFALGADLAAHETVQRFGLDLNAARKRAGQMPPGCDCARVVLGKVYPDQCALYGRACTPRTPIGPCMVSDEGACRIWWSSGVREPRADRHEPA
ncbi:hydrogenase formation protein HypD [Mesobacterium sp. TK19101]|uniref:Hydrogenase maturation factor n=1 Tax=Mesobacterium hydrothermale TaxID=3111907 RepID=A0ABU6HKB1_9RHOB|nr:hydrogenase formation protein HypD [Mesobacterium sp. TK19101]MEC3862777.1 hydrogenase formation protein HypD [Mesobacterium sp. TK19101]